MSERPPPASAAAIGASAVLTHHWLVRRRGGEKVLEALAELAPGAALYTLIHDPAIPWPPQVSPDTGDAAAQNAKRQQAPGRESPDPRSPRHELRVTTSFLQRLPGAIRHYPRLLPLLPLAAQRMKLPPVELVLCSDAAIAKAMTAHPASRVVCYCHSPMRYVWEPQISEQYARALPAVLRPLWPGVCAYVREHDRRAAQRVDVFVANSRHVAERIRRCYGREARVVSPPVELPPSPPQRPREDYYLCVGYHTPYKRLDLAVAACQRLGRRLVVVGDGPAVGPLHAAQPAGIDFIGYQPDSAVREHFARARALLFPGEEDFGIVPVEAMAHGCPVIAYGVGGARETVGECGGGVLFEPQSVEALVEAIERFERLELDPLAMHAAVKRFGRGRFVAEMRDVIVGALGSRT